MGLYIILFGSLQLENVRLLVLLFISLIVKWIDVSTQV